MNTTTEITVRPNGGNEVVRQEFGAVQTSMQSETAAAAVAAREAAAVQARYIVAIQRPRNVEQFRKRLMDMCLKPGFAGKAEYAKPLGKKWNPQTRKEEDTFAYGPSIRFIESALQAYGNIYPETVTVFDNAQARICRVSVTDLETNITYTTEVMITKVVERKGKAKWVNGKKTDEIEPPKGRIILGERLNSDGEPTYTVVATDDEILVKQNALLSKSLRTNAQRLLPYDIVEECMALAKRTVADKDAKDPDAAKREIIDYFASVGVEPVDIEAYIGKSLSKPLLPAELTRLRTAYKAVVSGESTWAELMESAAETGSEDLQKDVLDRKLAEAQQQQSSTTGQSEQGGGQSPATPTSNPAAQQSSEAAKPKPLQFGKKPEGSK